jgi:hypothetical protein
MLSKKTGIRLEFVLIADLAHKGFRDIHRIDAKRMQFLRIKSRAVIAVRNILKSKLLNDLHHGSGYFHDVDRRTKDKGVAFVDFS